MSASRLVPGFVIVLILVCHVASADVVYQMIDHGVPGQTLAGTVTVSDNAADDGILSGFEVTAWQIAVTGVDVNFNISNLSSEAEVVTADVSISPTQIFIEENMTFGSYYIRYTANTMPVDFYVETNSTVQGTVTYGTGGLSVTKTFANARRIHATVIPEPGSHSFLCLVGLWLASRRTSKRGG